VNLAFGKKKKNPAQIAVEETRSGNKEAKEEENEIKDLEEEKEGEIKKCYMIMA
jgi:hypothetical protein